MRERRAIAVIASHAVRPLPFTLPLARSVTRGATAVRAGFLLDRLVAFDRNRGVPDSHQLPCGRIAGGAAVWYDYVTTEADRLTFSFALAAVGHGGLLANHAEATALITEGPRVTGVHLRDRLSGRELDVSARITVNATGGSVDRLLLPLGAGTGIPMLEAMNLVTRREAGDAALGGRSASGRNLFMVPWRGRALFGTWESAVLARRDDHAGVRQADLDGFISELNQTFPALGLTADDVTLVHRGVVPAVATSNGYKLEGHDQVRDHSSQGPANLEGLVSVVGAKYTTARAVAERVTDRLLAKLHKSPVRCRTATTPLPGGDIRDVASTVNDAQREEGAELPGEIAQHLVAAYGSRYREILALCADRPDLKARVAAEAPVIGAELAWAARHEMAVTLADAVVRRTPLGALGCPGDAAIERAAAIVGAELAWPPERMAAEIASVRDFYRAP
jgi:glycerol-3-phosphate dehydrogenase